MASDRVLITGCGGMLGTAVYDVFSHAFDHVLATDIDLNEPWLSALDVRDIGQCERAFEAFRPTIVLHLAALTDLEQCERDRENCWRTNALGTENIGLCAERLGATMVHIGTAGVFGGEQDEHTDFDEPNPLSLYGKSKLYGERFVEQRLTSYYVFRPGWMMGGGPKKDKKFVNKIYKQIQAGADEIFAVDDRFGTPTYTVDFAQAMRKVIATGHHGLYNQACGGGGCSRFDVALEFVRLLGLCERVKVTRTSSDRFKDEYFATRPRSEQLVNLKLISRNINFMRGWKECLAEYSRLFVQDHNGRG